MEEKMLNEFRNILLEELAFIKDHISIEVVTAHNWNYIARLKLGK